MKKITLVLVTVVFGVLAKLGYDNVQINRQISLLQQTLYQNEQRGDNLNDQLIALQRKERTPSVESRDRTPVTTPSTFNAQHLIQSQLDLVQFALEQQQYSYAMEKLTQLDRELAQYEVADSLSQSIQQAIAQDQQAIQKFVSTQMAQQQQITTLIDQLDQRFKVESNNQQIKSVKPQTEHFWQKWFQIERVDHTTVVLGQRGIVIKEAQFRLLLAEQAFLRGDFSVYQKMLLEVAQLLETLPDPTSQSLKQQILQLKNTPTLPVPKLTSRTILG